MFPNLREDFKVNKQFMIRLVLIVYRYGHWVFHQVKLPIIRQLLGVIYKTLELFITRMIHNAEIPARTKIGKGLFLPHGGNGIVIHPRAVIGDNVTLFHQVTIGVDPLNITDYGPPTIGDGVFIGVGAKIIGRILIGENARIGANAVVITDIPSNSTAVGLPARVVSRREEKIS